MSEMNLLLVDYFNSLNNNDNEIIDKNTATYYENNIINENFLSIDKPSIELIRKFWNDNKSKDIKLIDYFNFNKFLNIYDSNIKNNISPVLIVNDVELRLIAINSNFIIEFSSKFINLNLKYINELARSEKAHANPKIGNIIKICLSPGIHYTTSERTLSQSSSIDEGDDNHNKQSKKNLTKKSKRKNRSLSESYCDVIKNVTEQLHEMKLEVKSGKKQAHRIDNDKNGNENNDPMVAANYRTGKGRSVSESHDGDITSNQEYNKMKKYKGILKHTIYNNPSIICETSEEDISHSFSDDWMANMDNRRNSDCSKKSVRFSDVIRKQLFRVNSSILGQRKKNHKKNVSRRRAQDRKLSESENSENEEHRHHFTKSTDKTNNRNI